MKTSPRIIICGSIAIDRIMNFEGSYKDVIQLEKLHTLSISIFLKNLKDTRGGVGANIAYSLALLGEKPVLLGSVGESASGYMADLSKMGVDITNIFYSSLPTATFNVITDSDDNQIGGFYPGAMFDSETLTFQPWADQNVFAVISPHDPNAMRRQVLECQAHGIRLFYDVGQQVSNIAGEDILQGIKAAEVLIVNDYELTVLCQKAKLSESELKSLVPIVVTTFGKSGSVIEGSKVNRPIVVGAAKPMSVVDPTGAGDAFRAGFLYGYLRDFDLASCGQLGSVAAVYAVETQGTQEHRFTPEEFEQRYQENFKSEIKI